MTGRIVSPSAATTGGALDIDMSVTVEVAAAFPGEVATEESMLRALSHMSRDEALIICAKINSIVSGFSGTTSRMDRQRAALALLDIPKETKALDESIAKSGIATEPTVFFRGQLLELARWIIGHCVPQASPVALELKAFGSAFLRAALIANELWSRRIFGDRLADVGSEQHQLQRALGAFRKSTEEGNEAPHPGVAVGHGWMIYSTHMRSRLKDFDALFQANSGLTLDQYYTCAFGLMQKTFAANSGNTLFSTVGFGAATDMSREMDLFVKLKSQTPESFGKSLASAVGTSGYKSLRQRPILNFSENRSAILDPLTYFDSFAISPLFMVLQQAGPARNNEIFSAFGLAFEDYAIEFLERMYPSGILAQRLVPRAKGRIAKGKEIEVDAILNDLSSLVVFEMKASWIREETVIDEDHEAFLEQLRKLYGVSSDLTERPKGVAQLANTIGHILREEWVGADVDYKHLKVIYPVLLVHDDRMGAAGLGRFLNEEFRRVLDAKSDKIYVHSLIIMTITDLENLATSIEGFSLTTFLNDYSRQNPERLRSIRNFMGSSNEYADKIRPSREIIQATYELAERIKSALFPKAKSNIDPT